MEEVGGKDQSEVATSQGMSAAARKVEEAMKTIDIGRFIVSQSFQWEHSTALHLDFGSVKLILDSGIQGENKVLVG